MAYRWFVSYKGAFLDGLSLADMQCLDRPGDEAETSYGVNFPAHVHSESVAIGPIVPLQALVG